MNNKYNNYCNIFNIVSHVTLLDDNIQLVAIKNLPNKVHTSYFKQHPGGRVTNAVGMIFRKIFVGTRARPI